MSTTTAAPSSGMAGKLGTWLMIIATVGLAFVICVELINILFYDPWSDDKFVMYFILKQKKERGRGSPNPYFKLLF